VYNKPLAVIETLAALTKTSSACIVAFRAYNSLLLKEILSRSNKNKSKE